MKHVIVLAAGQGQRMGMPKGLLTLPDGRTLLDYQLAALAGMDVTLVVAPNTPYKAPVRMIVNPDPSRGPFSSLQCALADRAVFVLPIDVPCPPRRVFDLLASFQAPAAVPVYQGRGGHPVYLGNRLVEQCKTLSPTSRLDEVLRAEPELARVFVDAPQVRMNLNSAEDVAAAFPLLPRPSR